MCVYFYFLILMYCQNIVLLNTLKCWQYIIFQICKRRYCKESSLMLHKESAHRAGPRKKFIVSTYIYNYNNYDQDIRMRDWYMNPVIWNFWPYKTNPQNESLENRPTKWIHNTNLLKKGLRIESAIQIFKVLTCESGFGIRESIFLRVRFML